MSFCDGVCKLIKSRDSTINKESIIYEYVFVKTMFVKMPG